MEAERDGRVWTSVIAMKGKWEIPGGPPPTAEGRETGLKSAPWGPRLSHIGVPRFLQIFTSPLSWICDLLSASWEAKYKTGEREESSNLKANQITYILCSCSFCTSSKSCLVRSSIFSVKRERPWKYVCTQYLEGIMSHVRKCGCENNHGLLGMSRTEDGRITATFYNLEIRNAGKKGK